MYAAFDQNIDGDIFFKSSLILLLCYTLIAVEEFPFIFGFRCVGFRTLSSADNKSANVRILNFTIA
jgi:hypothetical protein